MNVMVIAAGIVLTGWIATLVTASRRNIDLGSVSTQWLVEYRQSQE